MRENLLAQSPDFIPNAYGGGFTGVSVGIGGLAGQNGYFRLRNATAGLRCFIAFADISFIAGIGGRVQCGSSSTTQADIAMPRSFLDLQKSSTPTVDIQAGDRGSLPTYGAAGAQDIQIQPGQTYRYVINLIIQQNQGYWIMGMHGGNLQVTYWWFE